MSWYYDDPLFLEDWYLKTGRSTVTYKPEFGSRSWDFGSGSGSALEELKAHCGLTDAGQDAIILQHAEAALEGLDGYSGQLGIILQERTVVQPFARAARMMPLIGPVHTTPPLVLEWKARVGDAWSTLDSTDFNVMDEVSSWKIRLTESGINKIGYYTDTSYYGEALARASYTAGMVQQIIDLPADLRLAIYTLARRSFDYRDDTMPTSMMGLTSRGYLPQGVASILARYTKNVTIGWQ